jgi:hypothetical protein
VSLRIRQLKLIVGTANGDYGTDLKFGDGLVLLNVDNSRGKSTVLKSIVYALGLERMFGPVAQAPLPPAMVSTIREGDVEHAVISSWVFLEIENHRGQIVTIRRKVAGENLDDWKLVSVWNRRIAELDESTPADSIFYVRDPGSAQREQGFYTFLAGFLEWNLPEVIKYDGSSCPLYIETLLPVFFVEQTHGWSGVQATTPRFFQIRQPEKKAIEFVLKLDAGSIDTERQRLEHEEKSISEEWLRLRRDVDSIASALPGAIRDFPSEPQATWPPVKTPFVEVYREGEPVPLRTSIEENEARLAYLEKQEIPNAEQAAHSVESELEKKNDELFEVELLVTDVQEDADLERTNISALETRLKAIEEDLEHNKGTKKLRDLGVTQSLAIARGECPTCHQHIDDALLKQDETEHVMTLDENISYLEAQRQTLENMRARSLKAIETYERRQTSLRQYSNNIRSQIRSLKRTLVSAGTTPSEAAIRERVVLFERLRGEKAALENVQANSAQFSALSQKWNDLQDQKSRLSNAATTDGDRQKLTELEHRLIGAAKQFGFSSFAPELLRINRETYKPSREGFDLVYDVSASDNVRVIAAFLTALLEIARDFDTNHLGLLILDEPRQQNVRWTDLTSILERLSEAGRAHQQVIVATSDPPDRLKDLRGRFQFETVEMNFFDPILKKLSPTVKK